MNPFKIHILKFLYKNNKKIVEFDDLISGNVDNVYITKKMFSKLNYIHIFGIEFNVNDARYYNQYPICIIMPDNIPNIKYDEFDFSERGICTENIMLDIFKKIDHLVKLKISSFTDLMVNNNEKINDEDFRLNWAYKHGI